MWKANLLSGQLMKNIRTEFIPFWHQASWLASSTDKLGQYHENWCPGPCLTTATWRCRKNFSQWECSFLWKLRCHWLEFLRQRQIAVVRQGPGSLHHQDPRIRDIELARHVDSGFLADFNYLWHFTVKEWHKLQKVRYIITHTICIHIL